jgi:hypothetical protein
MIQLPPMRAKHPEDELTSNPPVVVELFGKPGAGKTTIAYAAAAGSDVVDRSALSDAWQRQSKGARAALVTRTLLDLPCLVRAFKLVIEARLTHPDSLSRLFRLLVKSHWIRSQPRPLLLSEGHLQDLWSILYSAGRKEPDARHLAPLIRSLFRGVDAQIVYLEIDPESAFDRISARVNGRSRLDRLTQEELRKQLYAHAELPAALADAARRAGLRVERMDATLPIETTVAQLRAIVQAFAKPPQGRG